LTFYAVMSQLTKARACLPRENMPLVLVAINGSMTSTAKWSRQSLLPYRSRERWGFR